ncbi:MFS transporter [Legionella tunisiensis]|uniref:hypothetical protein n=1 Tax=Legionella tunisiensis TaxID=1034944 RepID=UPI000594FC97|nr:hypothetical protein [Legionella tunisiensis]
MHYLLPYCLMFCGFMSWLVCGPFLVTGEFHYKPLYFGIFQMLVFGFYMIANRLVKSLVDKVALNQLIELGLFIYLPAVFFYGYLFNISYPTIWLNWRNDVIRLWFWAFFSIFAAFGD